MARKMRREQATNLTPEGFGTFPITITEGKGDEAKQTVTSYTAPATPEGFKRWVNSLPLTAPEPKEGEEAPWSVDKALDTFLYAMDLKTRAATVQREAALKPVVVLAGNTVNLETGEATDKAGKPIEQYKARARRVGIVNAAFHYAAESGTEVSKAMQNARARLLETKQARENDRGILVTNPEGR